MASVRVQHPETRVAAAPVDQKSSSILKFKPHIYAPLTAANRFAQGFGREGTIVTATMDNQELINLTNLGKTSVLWLNAVGIRNRAQLEERGVIGAFLAIRERGFRATKSLLFSLYGALYDTHWSALDDHVKDQLLGELAAADKPVARPRLQRTG